MHELGVLHQIAKTVSRIAKENHIKNIRHIALEVGELSGFVPQYLRKLYPVAAEAFPVLRRADLRISVIQGNGLSIKEIGY